MDPTLTQIFATVLFAIAVFHSFLIKRFQHLAHAYPKGSIQENFFHLMGEVEIVFGLWAGVFLVGLAFVLGPHGAAVYTNNLNLTEPCFVFTIMAIASTRPVIYFTTYLLFKASRPFKKVEPIAFYIVALGLGPLLGSLITEPAAMTVIASVLRDRFFGSHVSSRFRYISLAVLFVNVSIGGTLTNFAAPPVLMVASTWNWSTPDMFFLFGWKAAVAVIANASLAALFLGKEFRRIEPVTTRSKAGLGHVPWPLVLIHLLFLGSVVLTGHYMVVFLGIFLFFLGVTSITRSFQDNMKLRDSLLVGFFLAGLVVLGEQQSWWLKPLLNSLETGTLFLGATVLTAFTDNAALTFLGSQVGNLSDAMKYSLVAGAVAGGGLSVIANAPNPAGFSILKGQFGEDGISPLGLLISAIVPTFIAMSCLWFLP